MAVGTASANVNSGGRGKRGWQQAARGDAATAGGSDSGRRIRGGGNRRPATTAASGQSTVAGQHVGEGEHRDLAVRDGRSQRDAGTRTDGRMQRGEGRRVASPPAGGVARRRLGAPAAENEHKPCCGCRNVNEVHSRKRAGLQLVLDPGQTRDRHCSVLRRIIR